MNLVRVLIGVIGALLKAFTGAFLVLFHLPMAAILTMIVLAGIAVAIASACGFGAFTGKR